ncbi:MAG: NAD(P)H-binding protein [Chitinophagales bacterium]
MKLIVTGATGTTGSETVRQALADETIQQVTAIVRRPLNMEHPKLKTIIHKDFLNYESLEEVFAAHNACAWCLGVPQAYVTKQEYHVITYEYALAAAKAMLEVNPAITFLFVSGSGADSKEKSIITFSREKGKTENALMRLPFKKLIIPRPGGIYPITKPEKYPFSYNFFYWFYPLVKLIAPKQAITSVELAQVILYLLKNGSEKIILENRELRELLKKGSR